MYEASFNLKRRPFGATPDATCFLAAAPIQAALDEILVCIEQGQGISVLTAPAGVGKTLLCERLRSEFNPRFETVFLRHASFLTRRALLQTLLCELNHSYQHSSEQELRLALWPAIRELQPEREALVLICDEAHQLSKSLIEELRILADFAEAGKPLVRLVLVGQLNLEEKLALPSLEAFNQRIRAHVNLPTFDRAGSLDYIDYRLTWAGGRTDEVFTPQALDMIVQASDGVPRCINQLADHTLLLAFVAEQRPAGEELVREALNDLRQLPLHWNEPTAARAAVAQWQPESDRTSAAISSAESDFVSEAGLNGSHQSAYIYESPVAKVDFELPAWKHSSLETESEEKFDHDHLHSWESAGSVDPIAIETQSDDWKHVVDLFRSSEEESYQDLPDAVDPVKSTTSAVEIAHETPFEPAVHEERSAPWEMPPHADENRWPAHAESDEEDHFEGVDEVSTLSEASDPQTRRDVTTVTEQSQIGAKQSSPVQAMSNTFEEEVIFDRYAAIDAGFVPAFASHNDTAKPPKVHVQPDLTSRIERARDVDRIEETAGAAVPHSQVHESEVNFAFEPQPTAKTAESADLSGLDAQSHGLDQILGAVQELIELTSHASADFHPLAPQDDEATSATLSDEADFPEEFATDVVFDWNRREERIQRPHYVEHDSTMTEEVERTHDTYDAVVKSEWPSSTIPQDEEAILRSLQREIHAGSPAMDPHATYVISKSVSETGWESVETEPVESTEKARPFRYLFSMLRRKQQQTN